MKEKIYNVLEEFDWEEAASMFEKMNWEWAFVGLPNAVPTVKQLKSQAHRLIEDCIKNKYTYLSSGRISIQIIDDMVEIQVGLSDYGPVNAFSDILMDDALQ